MNNQLGRQRAGLMGLMICLALTAGACGGTNGSQTPATTVVGSGLLTPTGSECTKLPITGPGSVSSLRDQKIGDALSNMAQLATLDQTVKTTKLGETLKSDKQLTVFAPVNDAFTKMGPDELSRLLGNTQELDRVLKFHVIPERVTVKDLAGGRELITDEGATLRVAANGDKLTVGNANVVCGDIETSNGVIHLIDTVQMPPTS